MCSSACDEIELWEAHPTTMTKGDSSRPSSRRRPPLLRTGGILLLKTRMGVWLLLLRVQQPYWTIPTWLPAGQNKQVGTEEPKFLLQFFLFCFVCVCVCLSLSLSHCKLQMQVWERGFSFIYVCMSLRRGTYKSTVRASELPWLTFRQKPHHCSRSWKIDPSITCYFCHPIFQLQSALELFWNWPTMESLNCIWSCNLITFFLKFSLWNDVIRVPYLQARQQSLLTVYWHWNHIMNGGKEGP